MYSEGYLVRYLGGQLVVNLMDYSEGHLEGYWMVSFGSFVPPFELDVVVAQHEKLSPSENDLFNADKASRPVPQLGVPPPPVSNVGHSHSVGRALQSSFVNH